MTLGIDIGASKIAAVLWNGAEIGEKKLEEYPGDLAGSFEKWISWIKNWLADFPRAESAGVCVAGVTSGDIILKAPNLSILDGKNLKAEFEKILGVPIVLENDARAFIIAESRLGAAKGMKNVVGITLGTGVGGAIIIDGELYRGEHASAGEVGHVFVEGIRTFEELVSSRAFGVGSVKELALDARNGDKSAKKAFQNVALPLGMGLANIVNILDPEAIIVGGGISGAWDLLEASARAEMKKFIISPAAQDVKILLAQFGDFAPALGAALLAREVLQ